MCIFNGTFALWASGRVGEEAPLISRFDSHNRVWQARICWRGAGWALKSGRHLLGKSCLFAWMDVSPARDEYCMVMCSRGQVTGEDGSAPSPGAVTNAPSGPIFVVDYAQCQSIFPLRVKIIFAFSLSQNKLNCTVKKKKGFLKLSSVSGVNL